MRSDTYQILLIITGAVVTVLFGVFVYREFFPEYKIYQKKYVELEQFRSSYTHEDPVPFSIGVKQLVIEREDKGPPIIDRCTSCHVALQVPYYSSTKIGYDINGNVLIDSDGHPVLFPNEDYIWGKIDAKIAELRDEKVNEQLIKEGQSGEVKNRLKLAETYESLKIAKVGEYEYDVTKVLAAHPLIGKETRPFEYHPIEEYGCTSCHNGNGRGLVSDKAHGPVLDGQYEGEFEGTIPKFTESDPANDPKFSRVFNHKPDHKLLFQTQPLFLGALIQAKCMQCHQTSDTQIDYSMTATNDLLQKTKTAYQVLLSSFEKDKNTILVLLKLKRLIRNNGYDKTIKYLQEKKVDYSLPIKDTEELASQEKYLEKIAADKPIQDMAQKIVLEKLNNDLVFFIGSNQLVSELDTLFAQQKNGDVDFINQFIFDHLNDEDANGNLFNKAKKIDLDKDLIKHAEDNSESFPKGVEDQPNLKNLSVDVDELTKNYQRGKELFFAQACYACHRISGFSRGGVGPELTKAGDSYPWFIKQSIVWPQADVRASTMPNMRLDHEEIEDVMAFLLAQHGSNRAIAQTAYQASLMAWDAGRKQSWEKPISPTKIHDLDYSMTVFATEGCASCHRLQGFISDVGFKIEKDNPSFDELFAEKEWFKKLFPEQIHVGQYDEQLPGSYIVEQIEKHGAEIDEKIISDVRQGSILEKIEKRHPQSIESLYSNFKYAFRAKNHYYDALIKNEKDPVKKKELTAQKNGWKDKVHRVLMMYVQTYGLGRLIGPRPNWSGVYRSDEWLMEHFRNPSSHVPRSIMPVLPFDDTKFYALTYMLDVLGIKNRNAVRERWMQRGFDPEEAFNIHCAQCHGESRIGNGAVAEWIYPIPKNLRNPDFLRNLTKEIATNSITHGVPGTPMPPWGEVAHNKPQEIGERNANKPVLTKGEIAQLVDWLFSSLSGGEVIRGAEQVPKWQYQPEDVLKELENEGGILKPFPNEGEKVKPFPSEGEINKPFPGEREKIKPFPNEDKKDSLKENVSKIDSPIIDLLALNEQLPPKSSEKPLIPVETVFDRIPSVEGAADTYYIKKEYYTPENIEAGKKFFLINCAVCHGNEGDGSGTRSGAMQEAKPRMLTNLDWIKSRDDLRLLRSIKYGVYGTAMTPWGDLTSSLQRIQLVLFIRTLSKEQDRREQLNVALYKAFDETLFAIDQASINENQKLQKLIDELESIQSQLEGNHFTDELAKKAPELFQKSLFIKQKIGQIKEVNQEFLDLKTELKKSRLIYLNLGVMVISKGIGNDVLNLILQMIGLNDGRITIQEGKLIVTDDPEYEVKIHHLQKTLLDIINKKINDVELQKKNLEASADKKSENITTLEADLKAYNKLKYMLEADVEEALRSSKKQTVMIEKINITKLSEQQ